ncbi:MAG: orotidine-5'-phosphate decarboxylase [Patescibacteria group bacterium]
MPETKEKYSTRVNQINSLVCVGLDSNINKLPKEFLKSPTPQFDFNKWIIDQTHQDVAAYKPNLAFYEARGTQGWIELQLTMDYLKTKHPDIFTIADAKRADIGSTNDGYVTAIFDQLGFDAITLHPYLGKEALEPFLERKDKISIILCHTSNPGANELQNLKLDDQPLWKIVAKKVTTDWNKNNNCMLVLGATYPEELAEARKIIGEMTMLVPGIGAQGGDLPSVLKAGLNNNKAGLIINSSREIIFNDQPQQAAKELKETINQYR